LAGGDKDDLVAALRQGATLFPEDPDIPRRMDRGQVGHLEREHAFCRNLVSQSYIRSDQATKTVLFFVKTVKLMTTRSRRKQIMRITRKPWVTKTVV